MCRESGPGVEFFGHQSVLQVDHGPPLPGHQCHVALIGHDAVESDRAVDRRISEAGPVLGQADFEHAAGDDRDAVDDFGSWSECQVGARLIHAEASAGPKLQGVQHEATIRPGHRVGWLAR